MSRRLVEELSTDITFIPEDCLRADKAARINNAQSILKAVASEHKIVV